MIFNGKYKSMFGALIGDAVGAVLEFCHKEITEEMAEKAMEILGGGIIGTGPGQITDDGELTLCLWRALNKSDANSTKKFPYKECIIEYAKWFDSNPFDIGGTCGSAFSYASDICNQYDLLNENNIISHLNFVDYYNEQSEANGALMRISSLPTWAILNDISWEDTVLMSQCDAMISHPNVVCQEVNAIYVFIIWHLLKGYSPNEVLDFTRDFVENEVQSEKVSDWFFKESLDIQTIDCTRNIGHVRHAFSLAIYFLRNPDIGYEEAIKQTLMKGGDTDTNAAIVGGLVACYHSIPERMILSILEFDSTKCGKRREDDLDYIKGHHRPKEYCVKYVLDSA